MDGPLPDNEEGNDECTDEGSIEPSLKIEDTLGQPYTSGPPYHEGNRVHARCYPTSKTDP